MRKLEITISDAMDAHIAMHVTRQKRAATPFLKANPTEGDFAAHLAATTATEDDILAYLRMTVAGSLQYHFDGTIGQVPATSQVEAQIKALSDQVRNNRISFTSKKL